jgi:hypothetical protein
MTLAGPSVLDISQHFIERWNEVKKRKVRSSLVYSLRMLTVYLVPHGRVRAPCLLQESIRSPSTKGVMTGLRFHRRWKKLLRNRLLVSDIRHSR